jgi:hypothetical protein
MNVDEVVTNLNNRLVSDEVFSKHREVVFVCHSLGGLIVQRLLLTFRRYAQQVPFIYFFSTPESGAQIANLASVFSSDPLLKALIPGDDNDYLQNLENEWKASQFHIHRFCAYEKKKYKGVLIVDRLSGTRNCDDPPLAINENHITIVKPDGVNHDSYVAFRNAFKQFPVMIAKPTLPAVQPTRVQPTVDELKTRRNSVWNRLTATAKAEGEDLRETVFSLVNNGDYDLAEHTIFCHLNSLRYPNHIYIAQSNSYPAVSFAKGPLRHGGDGESVQCLKSISLVSPECADVTVVVQFSLIDQPAVKLEKASRFATTITKGGQYWDVQPLAAPIDYCNAVHTSVQ